MRVKVKSTDSEKNRNPHLTYISINVDKLPSKGKSYKKLNKTPVIKYRGYTFGETKVISSSKETNTIIDNILFAMNGIECNFKVEALTFSDFLYICILRRLATIGDGEAVLASYCLNCSKDIPKVIKTQDLEFQDMKAPGLPATVKVHNGKN